MSGKAAQSVSVEQPSTALTPIERAKVAINSAEHEKKLAELATASVSITAITNTAGYEQCHSARMALKKVRIDIERIGKGAREDAQSFSKAVIAEQTRLINIIEPEEVRLETIQREWDDARRREKEAKEEAERQRVAAIQARIDEIRQRPADAAGQSVAEIELYVRALVGLEIDDAFAELKQQAEGAKATSLIRLRAALTKAQAMETEQARLAAERVENERIRQENEARAAAQSARLAEEERVAREAREQEAAERQAAANLNNSRMSEIHGIQQQVIIAQIGRLGVRKGGTIDCIRDTLAETLRWPIEESNFGPLTGVAGSAKDQALTAIRELLAAAEAKAAETAEQARIRREAEAALQARIEAQQVEEARLEEERQARERKDAEHRALAEAEEQRLADARAQLERDQEALRLAREQAAAPPPIDIPTPESASVAQVTIAETATPEPEPMTASINLNAYLAMEAVCKAAKEWAAFQEADSKLDQKTDRKLATEARAATNNLLIAVEQL